MRRIFALFRNVNNSESEHQLTVAGKRTFFVFKPVAGVIQLQNPMAMEGARDDRKP